MMRNRNTLGGGSMLNMVSPINWLYPGNRGLVARWQCIPGLTGGSRLVNLARAGDKDWYHGTLTDGPTWVGPIGRPGGFGSVQFDGTNDNIALTTGPILTSGFSVFLWVKATVDSGATDAKRVAFVVGGTNEEFEISWTDTNAAYAGSVFMRGGGSYPVAKWTTTISAGTWAHVGATWNGSLLQSYINGVANASVAVGSMGANYSWQTSGVTGFGRWLAMNGDELIVHTRPLSAGEVFTNYEDSRRGSPQTLNWISTRTYFLAEGAGGVSPPEVPYRLRGGGIAEIAWPVWGQSFRF